MRPCWRAGLGREALQESRERLGGPRRGLGRVRRLFRRAGGSGCLAGGPPNPSRSSRMAHRPLLALQEGLPIPSGLPEGIHNTSRPSRMVFRPSPANRHGLRTPASLPQLPHALRQGLLTTPGLWQGFLTPPGPPEGPHDHRCPTTPGPLE